jgi:hypothetical protein
MYSGVYGVERNFHHTLNDVLSSLKHSPLFQNLSADKSPPLSDNFENFQKRLIFAWLERLAFNAKVATVLGTIPASSDTVESEGRQMKQC